MPQSAEYYFMILFARARKKEKESNRLPLINTTPLQSLRPLRTATTTPSRSGHHHRSATLSMEPEKGLTFNSFDEFKDYIQTWAVTKKFTPRVLKKDRYYGL
jgi:hypothetical protein